MSISLEKSIEAFGTLGNLLRNAHKHPVLHHWIENMQYHNPWFDPENVEAAMLSIGKTLNENTLNQWVGKYSKQLDKVKKNKTVGIVMAGNIPLVGFHDFLSVLMAGHKVQAKLSRDDDKLLPALAGILTEIMPEFGERIEFPEGKLHDFDAIIATGSNNTSRYFEYYFGKYPHIIRKNRNGVAIITGEENRTELKALGLDIFRYYGMGCRSISKLYVPENYDFNTFFDAIKDFEKAGQHHKYHNNYDYYKSIFLVNREKHLDNGFLLLKEDDSYASPPSVVYFSYYTNPGELQNLLTIDSDKIQCIVSRDAHFPHSFPFGKAQEPALWDYADGVDVMEFLLGL